MNLLRVIFIILGIFPIILFAQSAEWEKRLGGKGDDAFHAVIRNFDGDLVLAGTNEQHNQDLYFVVMSLKGEVLREKTIDLDGEEVATCVTQVRDKGYWLGGYRKSQ